jgi:hypothetical protein
MLEHGDSMSNAFERLRRLFCRSIHCLAFVASKSKETDLDDKVDQFTNQIVSVIVRSPVVTFVIRKP